MKTFSNYERLEKLTGMTLNEFMELEQSRSIELEFGMADTISVNLDKCSCCGSIITRTPKIYLYKSGCSPLVIELRQHPGETIMQCAERISKKPHYFKKIK